MGNVILKMRLSFCTASFFYKLMKNNIYSFLAWFIGFFCGIIFFLNINSIINQDFIPTINFKEPPSLIKIFTNNVQVVLINIFGGLTFGSLTILNLFYNGISFAILIIMIYNYDISTYLNLLPHIAEILGFILSGSLGLQIGYKLYNYIFNGILMEFDVFNFFKKLIIIIIFMSAFFETYVSTKI